MKKLFLLISVFFFINFASAQFYHHEIGLDVQAASFSTHGGTVGGALRYALVSDETVAYGPTFRVQYMWSKNHTTGFQGKSFTTLGGGAFFHYRFLEWFFLGAELEYLKNPYWFNNKQFYDAKEKKQRRWNLTAFVGGGFSKELGPVRLNIGILYDLVDGLNGRLPPYWSPLSNDYFMRVRDAQNPKNARYIPIIYRLSVFVPIGKKKNNEREDDYDGW